MDLKLEDSRTLENLKKSFYDETSLASRYHFFAIIAEFEGLDLYARLFRELAEGGTQNAHGNLDFLRTTRDPDSNIPIGSTNKNVESLLQTEVQQMAEVYPQMAKTARSEGFMDIASWFDSLEKLKRVHVERMRSLKK